MSMHCMHAIAHHSSLGCNTCLGSSFSWNGGQANATAASDTYTVSHLLRLLVLVLQLGLQLLHFPICSLPPALRICTRLLLLVMQLLQAWLNPNYYPVSDSLVIGAVASWTEKRGSWLGASNWYALDA